MAVTTVSTIDISQALADVISALDIRVHWYVSDAVRPPAVVIAQPTIDYTDTLSGFCSATWSFPLTLVVSRNNDRDAQVALASMLQQVTTALTNADVPGLNSIEPVSARPITVTVSGTDLPGYALDVNVRA